MKRVTIKMAPEFGAGNLLEAEKVRANLAALPLLGGSDPGFMPWSELQQSELHKRVHEVGIPVRRKGSM